MEMNEDMNYHDDQVLPAMVWQDSRLEEFRLDSLRKTSLRYLAWLVLAFIVSAIVYSVWKNSPQGCLLPLQLVYYMVLAVHIAARLKVGGRSNALAPDILFVFFYTLFHLGYVTLYTLHILPYSDYIFFFEEATPKALFAINIGLIGFIFGYELMGPKTASIDQQTHVTVPHHGWEIFGISLMVIALVMHFMGLVTLGFGVIEKYGYAAIQGAYRYTTSFFTVLMLTMCIRLMVLGLTIYLIASALRYGKLFRSKVALGLTIAFFIIVILEGERGSVLKFGIPILLVRHYFIKRIRIRYLIVLFLAAVFLFAGMKVVRKIVFKPQKMLQEYMYYRGTGQLAWYDAFVEMGTSFLVLNITCNEIPKQELYWKGASWLAAGIHAVPFLQGFAMRRGWLRLEPSDWVTWTYFGRERSGRGFTVVAEGYLNFGFPGVFVELLLLGFIVRWLIVKFSRKPSSTWAFIMLGCLGPTIMVIRNHLNLVTQPYVVVIVIAIMLNIFFQNEPTMEYEPNETASDNPLII